MYINSDDKSAYINSVCKLSTTKIAQEEQSSVDGPRKIIGLWKAFCVVARSILHEVWKPTAKTQFMNPQQSSLIYCKQIPLLLFGEPFLLFDRQRE
jgi:hypothetical protein